MHCQSSSVCYLSFTRLHHSSSWFSDPRIPLAQLELVLRSEATFDRCNVLVHYVTGGFRPLKLRVLTNIFTPVFLLYNF